MKVKILYTTFALAALAFLFLNSSGGRAASQNWGNTGAPGDEMLDNNPRTCQNCHATGNIQVSLDLQVLDANDETVEAYTPNETYTVKVSLNHINGPMPAAYGFQLVSLFDTDNSDVNGWTTSGHSDNVQIATASNTGRVYAEHNNPSNSNEFLVKWTAPESGKGAITFYSCGNGVNGNGASSGDGAATPKTLTLSENVVSAIRDNLATAGIIIQVLPNPVKEKLFLNINSRVAETIFLKIISLDGRVLHSDSKRIIQGKQRESLILNDLESGIYLLEIATSSQVTTKKLLKL